jgi:hypothetical protein
MPDRFAEVLSGKEDNYLLPILWQHGEDEMSSGKRWRGFLMRGSVPCA